MRRQVLTTLALVVLSVAATFGHGGLGEIRRLSAEFQYPPPPTGPPSERTSFALPLTGGLGGTVVYNKTLFIPRNVLFVTFAGTADVHGGAALLMSCVIDPGTPNSRPCRPEGGSPTGWITLQKLPLTSLTATTTPPTNCNNGSGGSADCHDNAVNYSWCTNVTRGVHTVQLRLATSGPTAVLANSVFYERATIYIDNAGKKLDDDDDDADDDDGPIQGCDAAPNTP
jgi:hypothetical protein